METLSPLIAASTQRQIGAVIAAIVLIAMVVYWIFNWIEGRNESGSEIELAANRKPGLSDEEMETKRLDLSLTGGLITLTIISVALPLYWLGEPGRQQGLVDFTDQQSAAQGGDIYEENCAQCHGSANGDGGAAADFSLVDSNGVFLEQVQWKAPSLGAVLDRYSYDEVKYILNYGRSNSPMPAWGGPGGGPMTEQQVDKVIAYLAQEQKSTEEIREGVIAGLDDAALAKAQGDNSLLYNAQLAADDELHDVEKALDRVREDDPDSGEIAALEAEIAGLEVTIAEHEEELREIADGILAEAQADPGGVLMGELLFSNPAASGAYGCARCHSAGWSYDANDYPDNLLLPPIDHGNGGFAPSLVGVADQFETAEEQIDFIIKGSKNGIAYGAFGQGDGGGQMPGFGQCWAEDNVILARIESDRIAGHCDGREGILTSEQIAAIVAYERSLD